MLPFHKACRIPHTQDPITLLTTNESFLSTTNHEELRQIDPITRRTPPPHRHDPATNHTASPQHDRCVTCGVRSRGEAPPCVPSPDLGTNPASRVRQARRCPFSRAGRQAGGRVRLQPMEPDRRHGTPDDSCRDTARRDGAVISSRRRSTEIGHTDAGCLLSLVGQHVPTFPRRVGNTASSGHDNGVAPPTGGPSGSPIGDGGPVPLDVALSSHTHTRVRFESSRPGFPAATKKESSASHGTARPPAFLQPSERDSKSGTRTPMQPFIVPGL